MLKVRKNGKNKEVIQNRLQGLLMDNKNLRSSQDLLYSSITFLVKFY